ncbi:MAG: hypothetical protein ABR511_01230 [Acidimicrobiales bacterium]
MAAADLRRAVIDVVGGSGAARARVAAVAAEVAGFDVGLVAPVAAAGAVMGRVSATGARWSGLPAGIPVRVAGHDHPVGAVGAGRRRDPPLLPDGPPASVWAILPDALATCAAEAARG